jgi:hypothetical protein
MEPKDRFTQEPTMQTDAGGELDLFSIIATWWSHRVRIALLALAGAAVGAAIFAAVYALRPSQQEATLTFRVLFDGVDKGQYPNGTRFTAADIVSTPVLQKVYQRNDLTKTLPFGEFKAAFSVIDSNPALERLRRVYQDRLNARALNQVDRSKLEDEYQSKLRAMQNNTFTLVAQLSQRSFTSWPRPLIGKVMNDILSEWVEESRAQGVFKFDLNVFSENIIANVLSAEDDYLVLVDRLRVTINRILRNLSDLSAIPGARLVRVGEQQVSLGEVEVALQDDLKFSTSKIESTIYAYSLYRDRTVALAYINDQLFKLQLEARADQSRLRVLDDALGTYSTGRAASAHAEAGSAATGATGATGQSPFGAQTIMPQLGDSFLNRVMELSTQNSDIAFRQDLARQSIEIGRGTVDIESERQVYERMLTSLNEVDKKLDPKEREDKRTWLLQQFAQLVANLKDTLRKVQLVHEGISQRSLQPSMVYTIVEPLYVQRMSLVSTRNTVLLVGFVWCVYVGAILVGLAWHSMNRGTSAAKP